MLAAVSRRPDAIPALEEVEIGEPRSNEALIRIVACGICHTDVKVNESLSPRPIVLGHEGGGIVERIGDAVQDLAVGDHVVIGSSYCGHCEICRSGLTPYCREARPRNFGGARMDGTSPLSQGGAPIHGPFFGQSSFAQYALVESHLAAPVPVDLPLEVMAPLGCGIMTGAGAVLRDMAIGPAQSLAVFGVGAVGLSAVMAAALSGASPIIAVDIDRSRLELAAELGVTATLHPDDGDVVEAIGELSGGGVDFSFNTTSTAPVFEQAAACLGVRGTAIFVAPGGVHWTPNLNDLMGRGATLRGIIQGSASARTHVPVLIDAMRRGRFPVQRLIRTYPFADFERAFEDAVHARAIKPVLLMDR